MIDFILVKNNKWKLRAGNQKFLHLLFELVPYPDRLYFLSSKKDNLLIQTASFVSINTYITEHF